VRVVAKLASQRSNYYTLPKVVLDSSQNKSETKMNTSTKVEVYSTDRRVPIEKLAELLKVPAEVPQSELSAVGWDDKDIAVDELATFFPFPRNFNREWESINEAFGEGLFSKGRLIVIRVANQTGAADENLKAVLGHIAAHVEGAQTAGKVFVVLDGFTGSQLQLKQTYNVTHLQTPTEDFHDNVYQIQVSGKRNHTYYVNLALKIFQRRDWYTVLELSGLGNAIPSIVSIAEILKRYKVAVVKKIETSLVELVDGNRPLQKAKIVVLMDKIASIPDIPEDAGDQVV